MDFDVTILLADSGPDPRVGETLFEAFLAASPGRDVVVSQCTDDRSARVWLILSADDAASASQTAIGILRRIEAPHQLVPTAIHVDAVTEPAPRAA